VIINVTYDSSVGGAPAGFKTAFTAAVQFLENTYTNPITINVDVGYGEINGNPLMSGALGESSTYFNNYTYSQVRSALVQNASSADQVSAANSLPSSDPTGSGNYWVATAEAKALGLMGPSSSVDAFVAFSSSFPFTYNDSNGVAAGTYDFYGVALHELTEGMGRVLFVGDHGIGSNSYTPLDLLHYSSQGTRDFSGTTAGYFSLDGGHTNLDNFNTNPNGDFGDWASSAGNNSFLAFSNSGVVNAFSQADTREMNALGYNDVSSVAAAGTSVFFGKFAGAADSDMLWQNGSTPTMWLMSGATVSSATVLPTPPASWHIVGTGDFNGDGKSDVLWLNTNNTPAIWEMNGTSIIGSAALPAPPPSWHIAGTGDFNGDGKSDILWINDNNTPAIWEMNGTSIIGAAALPAPPSSWHIVGTGDFNGDGKSDILWQNSSGTPAVWEMNGTSIINSIALPSPGPAWQLEGTADFNGDGKSDLLFLDPSSGQVQIWLMNGTQVSSIQAPTSGGLPVAPSNATPLSSAPVLGEVDGYFPSGAFPGTPRGPGSPPALGGALLAGLDQGLGAFGPLASPTGNLFTRT
jgi:hypothetical protein